MKRKIFLVVSFIFLILLLGAMRVSKISPPVADQRVLQGTDRSTSLYRGMYHGFLLPGAALKRHQLIEENPLPAYYFLGVVLTFFYEGVAIYLIVTGIYFFITRSKKRRKRRNIQHQLALNEAVSRLSMLDIPTAVQKN